MKKKFTAVKAKINRKFYLIPRTDLLEIIQSLASIKTMLGNISFKDETENHQPLKNNQNDTDNITA